MLVACVGILDFEAKAGVGKSLFVSPNKECIFVENLLIMYKLIIRPVLFLFDPEKVHHFTFGLIKILFKIPFVGKCIENYWKVEDDRLERKVFGLTFKNPIGLAAGLDKDAGLYQELDALGFGFVEIGTLTPKAQPGNPKKRLFRLCADEGIINRMGFNNEGVEQAVKRLKKNKGVLVGGNIGKNKLTPNEDAVSDYEKCFDALYDYVDYFVINVSSPNTPGLRALQDKEPLTNLLLNLEGKNKQKASPKPILLKIAPDLTNEQLDDIIAIVKESGIAGVVATNTTIERNNLKITPKQIEEIGAGGLSGKPVRARSTEVIRYLAEKSENQFPIIGVGGIHSAEDALEKLEAGASLVQLYTGFIYEGPKLIKDIKKKLLEKAV